MGFLGNLWSWLIDPNSAGGSAAPAFRFFLPWIIVCALGIIIPIYYYAEGRKRFFGGHTLNKARLDKFMNFLWPLAVVGFVLMFCRDAQMGLFGLRLWRYLWALWGVVYFGYWVYYLVFRYPKDLASYHAQKTFERYLPQPKAKRTKTSRA